MAYVQTVFTKDLPKLQMLRDFFVPGHTSVFLLVFYSSIDRDREQSSEDDISKTENREDHRKKMMPTIFSLKKNREDIFLKESRISWELK